MREDEEDDEVEEMSEERVSSDMSVVLEKLRAIMEAGGAGTEGIMSTSMVSKAEGMVVGPVGSIAGKGVY